MWEAMNGASLPESFAATLLVFLPKGVLPMECGVVWREEGALRPLGLQTTSATLIQHALNAPLSWHIAEHAHRAEGVHSWLEPVGQRAYIGTEARVQGPVGDVRTLPVAACFDFAAAIPNAAHAFLHRSMVGSGLPEGLICIIMEIHRMMTLHLAHDGGIELFSLVMAGVLQGSSLSGSLFTLVTALASVIPPSKGGVWACADDIAAVLQTVADVGVLEPVFSDMAAASGLGLHPEKSGATFGESGRECGWRGDCQ